uniref:Ripply transcriptional repressor 1 n=1 Tax=Anser cygnoides TaxID=8845 RepID=A0A8B9IEK0_ANSCY
MEAAACRLPPRCLPVPPGARPAPGLEQRGRYLGCRGAGGRGGWAPAGFGRRLRCSWLGWGPQHRGCRASAATATNPLSSPRPLPLWRPWLPREEEEATGRQRGRTDGGGGRPSSPVSPRRLLWPRSKSFDYLYGVGERLLRNFPVQATLCLYDDSGSEDEDEEELSWVLQISRCTNLALGGGRLGLQGLLG